MTASERSINGLSMSNGGDATKGAKGAKGAKRLAAGAALVALGVLLGTAAPPSGEALGQSRSLAPQDHLRSGGQLALPVLEKILSTLERMDGRLARLEAAAKQWQPAPSSRSPARLD